MVLRLYVKWMTWWQRQEGANMVEYVVIAAIIAVGLFAILDSLKCAIWGKLGQVITKLGGTAPQCS